MPKLQPHLTLEPTQANLAACLTHYNITQFEFSLPDRGVENTTVFVTAPANQKYVLRIYKQSAYTPEQIDTELAYLQHLAKNDIPVPAVILNSQRQPRTPFQIDNKTWQAILMSKLPGDHLTEFNSTNVRELAYYTAQMHRTSLQYRKFPQPPPPMCETLLDDQDLQSIDNLPIREFLIRARDYTIAPLHIPHALVHCDINRGNTLFENDILSGILDFEALHHGYLVEDIAATLYGLIRHIIYQNAPTQLLDVYFNTYQTIRPLTQEELVHLPNFLVWCTYYLAAADYLVVERLDELEQDLEMETKAVEVFKDWLHHALTWAT